MLLKSEIQKLESNLETLPSLIIRFTNNQSMFHLDFIMIAAIKRSLSLGHGLTKLIEIRNMTCCRSLVRMQIDTVSRLLAYTYVNDSEKMANEVFHGKKLNHFKSETGEKLNDSYLINKMSLDYPWVRNVYDSTCNDIHFTEKQFFDSISNADSQNFVLSISNIDEKYHESSWIEIVLCFNKLNSILNRVVESYINIKQEKMNSNKESKSILV